MPAGCCIDASTSHPLNSASASASKRATLAYRGPVASCPLESLLPFASRTPAGCCIAICCVPRPRVTFCCIGTATSLFAPAGCDVTSLCTTSASQRAAISRLAVSSLSPMRRRSCRQCAGVFIVIAIVIVTLIAHRRAGVVALVVVIVNVRHHCRCHRLCRRRPSRKGARAEGGDYQN